MFERTRVRIARQFIVLANVTDDPIIKKAVKKKKKIYCIWSIIYSGFL